MAYDVGAGIPYGQGASPYDVARNRANQRATASGQQGLEAIQRRYAAMGNLNSGAAIRTEQLQNQNNEAQKEDSLRSIDAQELSENTGRNYQANQQELARGFQANEAQKARDLQSNQFGQRMTFEQSQAKQAQENYLKDYELKKQQMSEDAQSNAFNKDLANYQKGHTGGFFGGGGFLGLGF